MTNSVLDRTQDRLLTDALLARHRIETQVMLKGPHPLDVVQAHSKRQAQELLDHAYDLEKRLHEMWQKYRWT